MGGRPDFQRMQRNAGVVFAGAGEAVQVRTYVSAGAASPQYGVNAAPLYTERTLTALFAASRASEGTPMPYERQGAGGQFQGAALMVTTPEPLHARDQLVWRGTAYRVAGESTPQRLGGRVMWRSPLELAAVA